MKRLLITGARGFIGRHVAARAAQAGFEVHGTYSGGSLPADLSGLPVTWHKVDLLAAGRVGELTAEVAPSHLLHAAWVTAHGDYWTSGENLAWVAATAQLVAAFAKAGGKRFVMTGSCAEYDWDHGFFVEGVTPERPSTLYGTAKLATHQTLMAAGRQFGFSAATGRVFFAYGPYENEKRIIPYACQMLAKRQSAKFSSGMQLRDFMHVDDLARGFVSLLGSDIQGACNVCSGVPVSLADIARTIGRISDAENCIMLGATPDRPNDPPLIVGDNRILRSTGWQPAITLQDGLAETYTWWNERATS